MTRARCAGVAAISGSAATGRAGVLALRLSCIWKSAWTADFPRGRSVKIRARHRLPGRARDERRRFHHARDVPTRLRSKTPARPVAAASSVGRVGVPRPIEGLGSKSAPAFRRFQRSLPTTATVVSAGTLRPPASSCAGSSREIHSPPRPFIGE